MNGNSARYLALLLFLIFCPPHARAEQASLDSVQAVRHACHEYLSKGSSSPDYVLNSALCMGPILASARVADVACLLFRKNQTPVPTWPGLSEGWTNGAMAKTYMNWADKHPEAWGKEAAFGYLAAMYEINPCFSAKAKE